MCGCETLWPDIRCSAMLTLTRWNLGVVRGSQVRMILPASQRFEWSSDAVAPAIPISTDGSGAHHWVWRLTWRSFNASGSARTSGNQWDAGIAAAMGGGSLLVTASTGKSSAHATLKITGVNPTQAQVTHYLSPYPSGAGFTKILMHESRTKNFDAHGEPLKSFDNGYGICQLTTPRPTFVQVWNWKSNVEGGLALFDAKRAAASAYLGQGGRTYTDDQLLREAICRWNGGSYHDWTPNGWVRRATVLCDSATGNIGWDMTNPRNTNKTESDLHKRDASLYAAPPDADANWMYSGVCYADAILG